MVRVDFVGETGMGTGTDPLLVRCNWVRSGGAVGECGRARRRVGVPSVDVPFSGLGVRTVCMFVNPGVLFIGGCGAEGKDEGGRE